MACPKTMLCLYTLATIAFQIALFLAPRAVPESDNVERSWATQAFLAASGIGSILLILASRAGCRRLPVAIIFITTFFMNLFWFVYASAFLTLGSMVLFNSFNWLLLMMHACRHSSLAENEDEDLERDDEDNEQAVAAYWHLQLLERQLAALALANHHRANVGLNALDKLQRTSTTIKYVPYECELERLHGASSNANPVPQCIICMEPVQSGVKCGICTLTVMHYACAAQWDELSSTCPVCRQTCALVFEESVKNEKNESAG